jgi:pimeloyl-ACP methyl ester carboxylesterase
MAILFAATYPERTSALILADAFARMMRVADYPCGMPSDVARACYETVCARWGSGTLNNPAPSMKNNPSFREWRGRFERLSLSPGALAAMYPVIVLQSDVRSVLQTIRVPTLVLHRAGNRYIRVGHGRYLAQQIAGAKYVELAGEDHYFHLGASDALLAPSRNS